MGQYGGQRDEQIRAGVRGCRPRRRGVRTGQNGSKLSIPLVSATAFIGRAKEEKFWELRDGTHNQAGQDKETCPNLHLIGEVLHLSTPPNTIPAQAQKKNAREKQAKKCFF